MVIKFKYLKLHNFMSYEDAELNLDRHGFVKVSGINNNPVDNAKSNGTGKSSLFSAISWALTGLTVGGSKEVANINLDGTASVELTFSVDDIEYKVIRTKSPSNLKLYIDNVDKSGKGIRDTEKVLSEYLPDITHSLLNSVIILGQGLPQRFTNNTPSGRKDVLEKLSNSEFMINDLKSRVNNRGKELQDKLRAFEDEVLTNNTKKSLTLENLNNTQSELNDMTDDKLGELQKSKLECESIINTLETDKQEITNQLNSYNAESDDLTQKLTDLTSKYTTEKQQLELEDISEIQDKINKLNAEYLALSKRIKDLDNVVDVCPTCGRKLDNVEKIDTSDMKLELTKINNYISTATNTLHSIENSNQLVIKKFDEDFNNQISDLKIKQTNLKNKIYELTSNLNEINSKISLNNKTLFECDAQINNFNNKKSDLIKSIKSYEDSIQKIDAQLEYLNSEIEDVNSHINVNAKMSTLLKRDFRGYLLSNVIEYISRQAKSYALDLFGTDKLEFVLDGNNIDITYDNKDYEVLSGGEKQKVDVIIQLSIRDMLCTFLNFSSNILVLDEITDSLDSTGSQKMFDLISTKLNDLECVYLISHHTDFDIPVDDRILIIKGSDKISRLA